MGGEGGRRGYRGSVKLVTLAWNQCLLDSTSACLLHKRKPLVNQAEIESRESVINARLDDKTANIRPTIKDTVLMRGPDHLLDTHQGMFDKHICTMLNRAGKSCSSLCKPMQV